MKSILERLSAMEARVDFLERDNIALREIIGEPAEEIDVDSVAQKFASGPRPVTMTDEAS